MANVDLHYTAKPLRRPVAVAQGARVTARETKPPLQRPAPRRAAVCRINAGQLIRSACLLLLCLGLSYLPRGEKLAPQGSVVEAANLKF
ncbi:hypothetical protein [Methylocystis echinoides]|uniref:Uncharacterized protein n=1 Tax=Methylocystis echinoides TaxID=29468 RepID=A0A9W6GUX4_9HYPH|nr:hypothetical protein [Methylocystis echinoides]GLI93506.1 hypothetical protein LMG27198_24980 [Methylocystis echinoides]